jgi:hypothetical protein
MGKFSPLFHRFFTAFSPLFHRFFTAFSPLFPIDNQCFTLHIGEKAVKFRVRHI